MAGSAEAITAPSVGDMLMHREAPFCVEVTSVAPCTDTGCTELVVGFADPMSGEPDREHASAFVRV